MIFLKRRTQDGIKTLQSNDGDRENSTNSEHNTFGRKTRWLGYCIDCGRSRGWRDAPFLHAQTSTRQYLEPTQGSFDTTSSYSEPKLVSPIILRFLVNKKSAQKKL